MSKILKVKARQIFDSRGNPTVEAEVFVKNNSASSICPSGASTGTHEAFEKRDKLNIAKKYKKQIQFINENINRIKPELIIEIGCGNNQFIEHTDVFNYPYLGIDIGKEQIEDNIQKYAELYSYPVRDPKRKLINKTNKY